MSILTRLPCPLVDAALVDQPEGCRHVAWHRIDAIDVLRHLMSTDVAVLGGDVLVGEAAHFRHTYDNWSCDHRVGESWSAYAERSRRDAEAYVTRYPERGEVAYVLEFQEKPSARDLLLAGGVDADV